MTDPNSIRLTQFAKRAGCAAKQPPDYLLSLLAGLPPIVDPNVLVGHATSDDAAVYRLSDDLALILTTDFFTPVVDRPLRFRRGGGGQRLQRRLCDGRDAAWRRSLWSAFRTGRCRRRCLRRSSEGLPRKLQEAGIAIVGGHTIQTEEPIFGLAVVGRVDPRAVITNAGAHAGRFLDPDQAAGPGDHHDGRQAETKMTRSHCRSDRRDDHAQSRRVRQSLPGPVLTR